MDYVWQKYPQVLDGTPHAETPLPDTQRTDADDEDATTQGSELSCLAAAAKRCPGRLGVVSRRIFRMHLPEERTVRMDAHRLLVGEAAVAGTSQSPECSAPVSTTCENADTSKKTQFKLNNCLGVHDANLNGIWSTGTARILGIMPAPSGANPRRLARR